MRLTYNHAVMFTALRIDGVNHAAGSGTADWGYGLWLIENNPSSAAFTELNKTADNYSFQLVQVQGNFTVTTVFNINPSTGAGTHWTATNTIVNTSENPAAPYGMQDWQLGLQSGLPNNSGYTLNGTSGGADRYMVKEGEPDGAWKINENVDRGATGMNAAGTLWGSATVLDNAAAAALGLKVGLVITAGSDTVAYYPADNIGNADVAANYQRVFIEGTPREFMGTKRADHVALQPGESHTANMFLDMNIIPEPATTGLAVIGAIAVILRRRCISA